ncbi:mRNA export factor elf1 [Exidia glandulosa HHB12029]|uniref:Elongation factor 3 n=1 Tax=Exidia glandulosa HHB12029 TaxID=1314781 RepID=A0A166A4A2_EXIGL|nr:mRNA export factor elf1 [Exidia glandulosa HHB12029]
MGSDAPSFPALFDALKAAPTAPEATAAADAIARAVFNVGLATLTDEHVLETYHAFANDKKSGFAREGAAIGVKALCQCLGAPALPLLLSTLPDLLELLSDKGDVVRVAANGAIKALISLTPVEATETVMQVLSSNLQTCSKWKGKVGCLKAMGTLLDGKGDEDKEEIAQMLGVLLPLVEGAMHDTKQEVATAAAKTATTLCATLPNPDLRPHIPLLISAMASPAEVPNTIKALSNTTFVAEVTAPSLAILVPLLNRGLNERSLEVQRRTVVITENVCKLVRDPAVAAKYLSSLLEGIDKIRTGASFPEVRAFAASAHKTLVNAGASADYKRAPTPPVDTTFASWALLSLLPPHLVVASPNTPGLPPKPFHPLLKDTLQLVSKLVAILLQREQFHDASKWQRCVGGFLGLWIQPGGGFKEGQEFATKAREHFWGLERAKHSAAKVAAADGEEVICDILFSLAYGALLLLSHTTLRLVKGHRYGICAANGSGKSTLLKSIRDGKVENFPPQEELRAIMVEHSLQGEDATLPIIEFIAADSKLASVSREAIRAQLLEVGFSDELQAQSVGSLSGGWKMKLELARAMLYKADLLLLDEPTNHLDRASVKWLEDYLISQKHITCLIVSHDAGFLDNVTTDIIHYEKKKIVYYPGPLSNFVAQVPSAKSYYTLSASTVKFSFPPPGSLMGVRSNTRAILKLTHCTYTYPGRDKPSLYDVSVALSLSSRVGITGPNGAGKSTMIKLLTGESEPQEGTVYKHPSLRVGYVSQHATHHIERHLEKTAIQYIQWRFQDGHDREELEKATRVMTAEDQKMMDTEIVGKTGQKRKIEMIMGRQKLKKTLQYEIKWKGLDHKFNTWLAREDLIERGFVKLVRQFDDLEASREGAATRDTRADYVRKHLDEVGLDGDIAQYNELGSLSGGQKVKVVIAAALWNKPQVLVLDEPTNFLDREALGGLAVAIRDWGGAVLIISHNEEFVTALCPEIWSVEGGRLTHKGKIAVVEDAFADSKGPSLKNTPKGTPLASKAGTPAASAAGTPAGSGAEDSPKDGAIPKGKKKKPTRNMMKAQEERRRKRKLDWLTFGGPKPEDTDSD